MLTPKPALSSSRQRKGNSGHVYLFARQNPIEQEKLALNRLVAKHAEFSNVLDAFAGDGTSSRIYALRACHVLAIDKDPKCLSSFQQNMSSRVSFLCADNLKVMPLLVPRGFDLVDLDPYGSCYPQIDLAARLLSPSGTFMITSGTIQRIVRGLKVKEVPNSRKFYGRKAALWAERVWIPYVLRILRTQVRSIRLIHFFASPVLVRAIFASPGSMREVDVFSTRPRYLGWFEKAVNGFENKDSQ